MSRSARSHSSVTAESIAHARNLLHYKCDSDSKCITDDDTDVLEISIGDTDDVFQSPKPNTNTKANSVSPQIQSIKKRIFPMPVLLSPLPKTPQRMTYAHNLIVTFDNRPSLSHASNQSIVSSSFAHNLSSNASSQNQIVSLPSTNTSNAYARVNQSSAQSRIAPNIINRTLQSNHRIPSISKTIDNANATGISATFPSNQSIANQSNKAIAKQSAASSPFTHTQANQSNTFQSHPLNQAPIIRSNQASAPNILSRIQQSNKRHPRISRTLKPVIPGRPINVRDIPTTRIINLKNKNVPDGIHLAIAVDKSKIFSKNALKKITRNLCSEIN